MATEKVGLVGWKTWNGDRCDHCCNGDRCDDRTHFERPSCPYCLGTGNALWLIRNASQAAEVAPHE